mgnify:CR=1 FL=1
MSVAGNVMAKLKNLVRAKWHRKLIEVGLEGQDGTPTADGREVVLRMLAEEAYAGKREEIGNGLLKRDKEIAEERDEKWF